MWVSRIQVIWLSLAILLVSTFMHNEVLGVRFLKEEMASRREDQVWSTRNNSIAGEGDFMATIHREVPSCPDPLHNR
ncbi:hypothetical protein Syun_007518 [Stephania yunnanensis]|uniref:Uncharacterized protein n=1 Tax=Stephania yunnanensis TaxID=152371 RepID=A0AAP0L0C8_9MAGN